MTSQERRLGTAGALGMALGLAAAAVGQVLPGLDGAAHAGLWRGVLLGATTGVAVWLGWAWQLRRHERGAPPAGAAREPGTMAAALPHPPPIGEGLPADPLREGERRVRSIADALPGMVGYWDASLHCRFANAAYLAWFGRAPEDLLGCHIEDLLGPTLYAKNLPYIRAALGGEVQQFERTLTKADGSVAYSLAVYVPDVVDGRVQGFNVIVSDITPIKRAELQLAELNEQLYRRAAEAEAATRAKSVFVANVSHEIRTPLNAIIGLNHLMARDAADARTREHLRHADEAARHLLRLLDDVLDLSKVEAGRMTLDRRPFQPRRMVERVVAMVQPRADEKSLPLAVELPPDLPALLVGDETRLAQSLLNLLGNAVKFTAAGQVRVRLQVLPGDGEGPALRFEVDDTGPGLSAGEEDRLFRPFEQGDGSATRRHGGTGLGLALTRRLAELMGGQAGFERLPAGSRFWFSARLRRPAPFDVPDVVPVPAGLCEARVRERHAGRRVLVVEDHAINREVACELLTRAGLQVEAAVDGQDAVDRCTARPYDLVLMDMQMPRLDGLAAARALRARGWTGPIVAMTANAYGEDRERCRQAGMDDFLEKPVDPERLYDCVDRWLSCCAAPAAA